MPKFAQEPLEKKVKVKGVPPEAVEEYKKYIEGLEKGNAGLLEFGKDENMALGRRALQEAGIALKKYVRVQKVRGEDNKLRFYQITKKEYDEALAMAKARGEKLRGRRRAKK